LRSFSATAELFCCLTGSSLKGLTQTEITFTGVKFGGKHAAREHVPNNFIGGNAPEIVRLVILFFVDSAQNSIMRDFAYKIL